MNRLLLLLTGFLFMNLGTNAQVVRNPLSIEVFFGGAKGSDIESGLILEDSTDIMLSLGGGALVGINIGYRFDNYIEVFFSFFSQHSSLDPPISNATGTFTKQVISPIVSYKFHPNKKLFLNIGVGFRSSMGNELDIDASDIDGGGHNIFIYKDDIGPSGLIGLELYASRRFSLTLSSNFYSQKYKLAKVNLDGTEYDIDNLNPDVLSKIDNLKGSGIDLKFGLRFHL